MKKLHCLFASVLIIGAMISCSEDMMNDVSSESGNLKCTGNKKSHAGMKDFQKGGKHMYGSHANVNDPVLMMPSAPASVAEITPYIIPGENKGGNRTCENVAAAWNLDPNPFLCGQKNDFVNGHFTGKFPSGISVTVSNNRFVSFAMDDCILIGDKYYKVGAVIVKGSNAANVYYYPDGIYSDAGLAAPANSNCGPAGLSNLTFCLIECEQQQPEWVIALKTYFVSGVKWAASGGEGVDNNDLHMGYNLYDFNGSNIYPLLRDFNKAQIGTIEASDYWENGIHYLEVMVEPYDEALQFSGTHLYVGTLAGFNAYYDGETIWYNKFPFVEDEITGIRVFKIPFSDITE